MTQARQAIIRSEGTPRGERVARSSNATLQWTTVGLNPIDSCHRCGTYPVELPSGPVIRVRRTGAVARDSVRLVVNPLPGR